MEKESIKDRALRDADDYLKKGKLNEAQLALMVAMVSLLDEIRSEIVNLTYQSTGQY